MGVLLLNYYTVGVVGGAMCCGEKLVDPIPLSPTAVFFWVFLGTVLGFISGVYLFTHVLCYISISSIKLNRE